MWKLQVNVTHLLDAGGATKAEVRIGAGVVGASGQLEGHVPALVHAV